MVPSYDFLPLKVKPDTIKNRIEYLYNIIKGNITLKPGQIDIISKPCDIKNVGNIFGGKFDKIGSGRYGKVFKVCIDQLCDYEFALKEIEYLNDEEYMDINNPYRPENVEVRIFRLLNDLVLIGSTPHIPLYFGDFRCKIGYKYYRYLMMEKADGDLFSLFNSKYKMYRYNFNVDKIIKVPLFQVIYTLCIIFKRYPNFIHNDLKLENILYFKTKNKNSYNKYIVHFPTNDQIFTVPNTIRTGIWDFGFSSIIGEKADNISTEYLTRVEYNMQTEANHYMDIFKLLLEVKSAIENLKSFGIKDDMEDISKFVDKYTDVPESAIGSKDDIVGLKLNIEPYSLEDMLNDSYFDEFRSDGSDGSDGSDSPNSTNIVNTYSDELVKNMDMVRLNPFISIDLPETDLEFTCDSYKNVIYFEYRDNKYNNKYRVNCNSSRNKTPIVEKYIDIVKSITNKSIKNMLLNFDNNLKIQIVNMFHHLFEQFVNNVYVPITYLKVLSLVIVDKSIFLVTKQHQIDIDLYQQQIAEKMDIVVQFNQFMNNYGLVK